MGRRSVAGRHRNLGGSGRLEEQQAQPAQVQRVHDAVAVEVCVGLVGEEHFTELTQVRDVDDAVVVEVGIAGVTESVSIRVLLIRVGNAVQLSIASTTPSASLSRPKMSPSCTGQKKNGKVAGLSVDG